MVVQAVEPRPVRRTSDPFQPAHAQAYADLWASCIGGAAQEDAYRGAIEGAGLQVEVLHENPYKFISDQALDASEKYGVKSVSLLARKT